MRVADYCLLAMSILSGLSFLLCLAMKPGGYTFYVMVPYPNGRTPFPSTVDVWLMAMRSNPWLFARLVSLWVLALSAAAGIVCCPHGGRRVRYNEDLTPLRSSSTLSF